jgi:hypothetical protein
VGHAWSASEGTTAVPVGQRMPAGHATGEVALEAVTALAPVAAFAQ